MAMAPNEFGDFLAGCFAPLAFFWLVLGFFQQGDELRNSVAALHLQGEELRNSVEQQKQLVDVTREQLGLDRASKYAAEEEAVRKAAPIFHVSGGFSSWTNPICTTKFTIRNVGAECRQLHFCDSTNAEKRFALFKKDDYFEIAYQLRQGDEVEPITLSIKCDNAHGHNLAFQTTLDPDIGHYGPEYKVTAEDGLFVQTSHHPR